MIIIGLEKTETAMIEKRVVTMREMKFTTGVRRCRGKPLHLSAWKEEDKIN